MSITTPQQWRTFWQRHLADYLRVGPRTGQYLEMLFADKSLSFLEIAGGSLRDANYLAEKGYAATGSDFLCDLVEGARSFYRNPRLHTLVLDAFNTQLDDGAYDVTFHNGFLVYFRSDNDIKTLLAEQVRITRAYVVAVVHSAHNPRLRQAFASKARCNPLFDIRFFKDKEMRALLQPYGRTRLYPYGGSIAGRLLPTGRLGRLPLGVRRWIYRMAAPLEPRSRWERIIAVTSLAP